MMTYYVCIINHQWPRITCKLLLGWDWILNVCKVKYKIFVDSSKPKSEMTQEELNKREEEEFLTGPLSILAQSVKNNTQVGKCWLGFSII